MTMAKQTQLHRSRTHMPDVRCKHACCTEVPVAQRCLLSKMPGTTSVRMFIACIRLCPKCLLQENVCSPHRCLLHTNARCKQVSVVHMPVAHLHRKLLCNDLCTSCQTQHYRCVSGYINIIFL